MSVSTITVLCGSCKQQLGESSQLPPRERMPCPNCGATTRIFKMEAHVKVTPRVKSKLKHKRPGFKKPIYEQVSGDDLYRKTGLWSKLFRVIDRQNNRYKEEFINSETGEVLRSVDEPLARHVNRGSARKIGGSDETIASRRSCWRRARQALCKHR